MPSTEKSGMTVTTLLTLGKTERRKLNSEVSLSQIQASTGKIQIQLQNRIFEPWAVVRGPLVSVIADTTRGSNSYLSQTAWDCLVWSAQKRWRSMLLPKFWTTEKWTRTERELFVAVSDDVNNTHYSTKICGHRRKITIKRIFTSLTYLEKSAYCYELNCLTKMKMNCQQSHLKRVIKDELKEKVLTDIPGKNNQNRAMIVIAVCERSRNTARSQHNDVARGAFLDTLFLVRISCFLLWYIQLFNKNVGLWHVSICMSVYFRFCWYNT